MPQACHLYAIATCVSDNMLPVSINDEWNSVNIPFGSKFSISYRSKTTGIQKIARMEYGKKQNHIVALFDQNNVDFQIEMENSSGDRFVRFNFGKKFAFVTMANSNWKVDRLEPIGKFFFSTARRSTCIEFDVHVECSKPPSYSIYVNIGSSKKETLEVNRLLTVRQLKKAIKMKYWIGSAYQILYLDGKPLDEILTMEAADVKEYSTLDLKGIDVSIMVKILPNNPVTLEINALDTVAKLKIKIEEMEGIPVSEQHLYVDDKEIFDDEFLETSYFTWRKLYLATKSTDSKYECLKKIALCPFRVNVRKFGSVFPVDVCSVETVEELRRKIQDIEDAPPGVDHPNFSLFHQGKRLKNDLTLEVYKITDGSTIDLHVPCTDDQHVCIGKEMIIKSLTGELTRIPYCGLDTIETVKCRIQSKKGSPIDQQRLIYGKVRLENERTLNDHGFCPDTPVCLGLCFRTECKCSCGGFYDCKRYIVWKNRSSTYTNFKELPSHNLCLDKSIKIQPFVVELRLASVQDKRA